MAVLAVVGNIVTAGPWIGDENMLGVGLHSYGFMDKPFPLSRLRRVPGVAVMIGAAIPCGMVILRERAPVRLIEPPKRIRVECCSGLGIFRAAPSPPIFSRTFSEKFFESVDGPKLLGK